MASKQRATFQAAFGKTGSLTLRQTGRAEELRLLAERKAAPCSHRNTRNSLYAIGSHCPRCGTMIRKELVK